MKILPLAFLVVLLLQVFCDTVDDYNEGLCIKDPNRVCPQSVQKYGVCGKLPGDVTYRSYNNFCQACQNVKHFDI
jgi:hypothetical protein